jgi:hypothetical protein
MSGAAAICGTREAGGREVVRASSGTLEGEKRSSGMVRVRELGL